MSCLAVYRDLGNIPLSILVSISDTSFHRSSKGQLFIEYEIVIVPVKSISQNRFAFS